MNRLILVTLSTVILLVGGLIPQQVCAGDGDKSSNLTREEKALTDKIRRGTGEILNTIQNYAPAQSEILQTRELKRNLMVLRYELLKATKKFCSTGSVPPSLAEVANEWGKVCSKVRALCNDYLVKVPSDVNTFDLWVNTVNAQVGEISSLINATLAKLNERVAKIQEERAAPKDTTGGTSGSQCFIATAAYGTSSAKEIDVLRRFRDEFLMNTPPGRALVAVYYQTSPPVAEFISEHEALRTVVREGIVDPTVKVVEFTEVWWAE